MTWRLIGIKPYSKPMMTRFSKASMWVTCPGSTTWWRHQVETFSALLILCAGNSPVTSEFLAQRPVTRSFDVFFDLRLNKQLSKRSCGWWFETPSRSLWRRCNEIFVPGRCGIHLLKGRFSNSYYGMNTWPHAINFSSASAKKTPLMISQHWFR